MKLIFIHGAGSSSLVFYYQLRHFRNSKAIDLPGHPSGTACSDITGYVEWVRGFINARRYKNVVLCGHSMGGAITLEYALRYPNELKGIVLLGTGGRLKVNPKYLEGCQFPGNGNEDWLKSHMKYYKSVERNMHPVLAQRALEVGPEVELNDLRACDKFDILDQVDQIKLPACVMCGADDEMTPLKYSNYLAEKIKNSSLSVITGGGHFVQLEQYQTVNKQIEEFLASLKN